MLLDSEGVEAVLPEASEPIVSVSFNQPIKVHQNVSSPKSTNSSPKVTYSPKLSTNRETTHVKQINVADFAKLHVQAGKSAETQANSSVAEHQNRMSKVKFKGASNSVPSYNEKQENIKNTIAQNDALLATVKLPRKRRDHTPMYVSKIEPKSPQASSFLLPTTVPQRNKFIDMLIGDNQANDLSSSPASDTFPRLHYGSPPPPPKRHSDLDNEIAGEISIPVPRLPHLISPRAQLQPTVTADDDRKPTRQSTGHTESTQHTDDDPVVIVTNEDGVSITQNYELDREGWDSGFNSTTPRLSIDSRAHALTPMSGLVGGSTTLDIPNDHRSLTPFSTITTSTYLDQSRPQSRFLDVPHFIGDSHETSPRRFGLESRPSVTKLPAIYSRNDDTESMSERNFDFTPLPIQSVRTSDGEMSD